MLNVSIQLTYGEGINVKNPGGFYELALQLSLPNRETKPISLEINTKQNQIAMNSLQDLSVKQVFSTLRENFTPTELQMLEHDIDQLLTSSESLEQLISFAKEALENRRTLTAAA